MSAAESNGSPMFRTLGDIICGPTSTDLTLINREKLENLVKKEANVSSEKLTKLLDFWDALEQEFLQTCDTDKESTESSTELSLNTSGKSSKDLEEGTGKAPHPTKDELVFDIAIIDEITEDIIKKITEYTTSVEKIKKELCEHDARKVDGIDDAVNSSSTILVSVEPTTIADITVKILTILFSSAVISYFDSKKDVADYEVTVDQNTENSWLSCKKTKRPNNQTELESYPIKRYVNVEKTLQDFRWVVNFYNNHSDILDLNSAILDLTSDIIDRTIEILDLNTPHNYGKKINQNTLEIYTEFLKDHNKDQEEALKIYTEFLKVYNKDIHKKALEIQIDFHNMRQSVLYNAISSGIELIGTVPLSISDLTETSPSCKELYHPLGMFKTVCNILALLPKIFSAKSAVTGTYGRMTTVQKKKSKDVNDACLTMLYLTLTVTCAASQLYSIWLEANTELGERGIPTIPESLVNEQCERDPIHRNIIIGAATATAVLNFLLIYSTHVEMKTDNTPIVSEIIEAKIKKHDLINVLGRYLTTRKRSTSHD